MNWVQLAVALGLGSVLLGCGAGGLPRRLQGHGGQPGATSTDPATEDGRDAGGGGMADADVLTGRTQLGTVDAISGTASDGFSVADGPPDVGGLPPATGTGGSAVVRSGQLQPDP